MTPGGGTQASPVGEVLSRIRGKLVVSCQAYPGEPMRSPQIMAAISMAVLEGGAAGLRLEGIDDISRVRPLTSEPIFGLVKRGTEGVFITPTVQDALACVVAGADLVALDGTPRPRPDRRPLADSIAAVQQAGRVVAADCATAADAAFAVAAGADCVTTALAGYTPDRAATDGPDFALLAELVATLPVPVIAEGRVRTPDDLQRCLELGAHAVIIGSAITHPTRITRSFVESTGSDQQVRT